MSEYYAKIIADSIASNGKRITTIEVCCPRFILAEVNTHRSLSRNSASSRATPVKKRIESIKNTPVYPIEWGVNKPGMQATEVLTPEDEALAKRIWIEARDACLVAAEKLDALKTHKQISNRIIETWAFNTQVITSTDWENHDFQRTHIAAQPEYQHTAKLMRDARRASTPKLLLSGQWHLPYIKFDEMPKHLSDETVDRLKKCSVARCARVSGVNFETGTYDQDKDLALFAKLVDRSSPNEPKHWSPLEHIATPIDGFDILNEPYEDNCDYCYRHFQNKDRNDSSTWSPIVIQMHNELDSQYTATICWKCAQGHCTSGNLFGWKQFRKEFADENRDRM